MKKFRLILLACLLILLFAAGCGKKKPTEIDPTDYFSITFSGYDGYGTFVSLEFDAESMRKDFEAAIGETTKSKLNKLIGESVKVSIKNDSKYSNGDTISIEWDANEEKIAEFEQEYNVSFILKDFELKVSGLATLPTFDPFKDVTVDASGISGSGNLSLSNNGSPSLNLAFLDDSGNKTNRLYNVKNGDKVQIVININVSDINEYCINKYEMIPTRTTMEYTVSGLDEYVTDISQLTSELTEKIKTTTIEKLKEQASNWIIPDSLCEITYMGDALRVYTGTSNYYSNGQNNYIVLFKVDVDSPRDGIFSYYFTGAISNILKNSAGEFTYNDVSVPTHGGWWSGISFAHNDLYYAGYETYESMESSVFNDIDVHKDVVKFDKTIIEKATHTPKDYTVIDATVTLEAADVCYKRNDGYNTIVGFTQSGYDKIMAYTAIQQIKLILPSKDTEGSDVDDVHFYSRAVSSTEGFNFNTLIETENSPRIYLVIPDTCSRYNGFRDSNINTSSIYKISGVDLGTGIKSIGNYAFTSLTGITSVTIPADIAIIPYSCFKNCSNLKTVEFLGKITKFEEYAFEYCNNLVIDELRLVDQLIYSGAFSGVTINHLILASDTYKTTDTWYRGEWNGANVLSLEITDGITIIRQNSFRGLNTVKELIIPDSVVEIGENAFKDCTGLTKVTFPAKMPKLDEYAFYNCTALIIDSLVLDETLILSNECLYGVTVNTATLTSDKFETSSEWGRSKDCLEGCNVKNFVIADTVTTIPSYLFSGMKFTNKIELPSSVTTIKNDAFHNYYDLIKLVCGASVVNIGDNIDLNDNVTVYAPNGSAMITYCINKGIRYEITE